MHKRIRLASLGAALLAVLAFTAFATTSAFGAARFSNCPQTNPAVLFCINVQSTSGNLRIKNNNVPLNGSIVIDGGVVRDVDNLYHLVTISGTGFTADPVPVPGGLLGLDLPFHSPNDVFATAQAVGTIRFDSTSQFPPKVTVPLRVKLSNPFLGNSCYIGSSLFPITLNQITGTTNPPPPNQPISGTPGTLQPDPTDPSVIQVTGTSYVDNAFSVPLAFGCGLLQDAAIDLKLGLPSAAGNNEARLNPTVSILNLQ